MLLVLRVRLFICLCLSVCLSVLYQLQLENNQLIDIQPLRHKILCDTVLHTVVTFDQ